MTVETVDTEINGKWTLKLPAHRAARPEWPWWEKERLASMREVIGEGHVVYDVGAEEGDLPALWASWGAEVVLVEPNPRVWPNIKTIFDANGLGDKVLACVVGFAADEDDADRPIGVLTRATWPLEAFDEVIGDHGFLNLSERPDVARWRLDTIAETVKRPTAITIDVEGAEFRVLLGAERILRMQRPHVWVSIHPAFMAAMYGTDRPQSIFSFMAGCGYVAEHLATDHEEHWHFLPS